MKNGTALLTATHPSPKGFGGQAATGFTAKQIKDTKNNRRRTDNKGLWHIPPQLRSTFSEPQVSLWRWTMVKKGRFKHRRLL